MTPTPALLVRRSTPDDAAAIRAVHGAAFPDGPDNAEVRLVDALRSGHEWIDPLSLVAVDAGPAAPLVVGHVVASRAVIERGGHDTGLDVVGLGPLGVLPGRQRGGVGSALMYACIGAAEALGVAAIGLLGSPEYYARFGFVAAAEVGVEPPDPAWGAHFQLLVLSAGHALGAGGLRGVFRYAPAFDGV